MKRVVHRRAPKCLRPGECRDAITSHQPVLDQLPGGLPVPHELAPAPDRDDDLVRQRPVQLLGRLERQRLRALGVERPDVDVAERPRRRLDQLRAKPVHLVVVAAHRDHVRVEHADARHLRGLEVDRDEYEALEVRPRRVSGHGVREVASRRTRDRLETMRPRPADGDRHDTVLERVGRIHAVVLQIEIPQAKLGPESICLHERSETLAQSHDVDRVLDRQQVAIPPHRLRAGFDARAAHDLLQRRLVVHRVQWPEAHLAHVSGLELVLRPTLPAPQTDDLGHRDQV